TRGRGFIAGTRRYGPVNHRHGHRCPDNQISAVAAHCLFLSTSSRLTSQTRNLGSAHHFRRLVIPIDGGAEEARQNVRPFRHAESESHARTDLSSSLAIDARAA